ncbi:hypothetical protein NC651_020946 [Populus alba x Populus x berolinensis]|nr:hypothetical protein NC651_020946 [Populus alba x Populus x berolinensis]
MFSAMGLPLPDLSKRGRKEASGTEGNSARQWFQDRLCHLLSALQTWHRITLLNKDGQIRMGIQMNCQRIMIFFLSDFNALPSASEKIDGRPSDHHKIASCHRFLDSPGSMDLGFRGYIHSE